MREQAIRLKCRFPCAYPDTVLGQDLPEESEHTNTDFALTSAFCSSSGSSWPLRSASMAENHYEQGHVRCSGGDLEMSQFPCKVEKNVRHIKITCHSSWSLLITTPQLRYSSNRQELEGWYENAAPGLPSLCP